MAKARKEIDKDSMYQKIMPSAMRSVQPVEEDAPAKPAAKKAPARSTPRKSPAKPAPAASELPEDDIPEEAPAAAPAPRKAAPARRPAAATPAADATSNIVNIMELLIDNKIEVAMDKFHCCDCDKCRQDITAMALNKLHPKYIIAEPEELETAMADKEANTQVTTALVQAILKVKANPKH